MFATASKSINIVNKKGNHSVLFIRSFTKGMVKMLISIANGWSVKMDSATLTDSSGFVWYIVFNLLENGFR